MRKKPHPSLQDLIDFVEEKTECSISPRSIQYDIHLMRNDVLLGFNAPIEFDKQINAYVYTDASYILDHEDLMHEYKKAINKLNNKNEEMEHKKNDVVMLKQLAIGDRFYFFSDSKKTVYTKVECAVVQTYYKTYRHFALQDGKKLPDMKNADTKVVFLRKSNPVPHE